MFCENCGTQISDNEKVCPKCGHIFEESETPVQNVQSIQEVVSAPETPVPPMVANAAAYAAAPAKKPVNKLVIIIACAAVGVILLVVLLVALIGAFSGSVYKPLNSRAYIISDSSTNTLYNGTTKLTELDTSGDIYQNGKGTTFVSCSQGSGDNRETDIYLVNGNSLKKFASGDIDNFRPASDSDTVCYIKDDNLYVNNNGSEKKIAAIDDSLTSLVISPDGSAIAWTVRTPEEYDDYGERISEAKYHTYAYNGGKEIQIATFTRVYSVSAGGKIIYGRTKNDKLAICRDMKDESEPIKDIYDCIAVSSDGSQILFAASDSRTGKFTTYFFGASFKEAVKVHDSYLSLTVPDGTYYSSNNFDSFLAETDRGSSNSSSSMLYRFTRKGNEYESYKVLKANELRYSYLSQDGNSVIYLNKNKIYKKETTKDDAEPVVIADKVNTEMIRLGTDNNLTGVYYLDANGDLKYSSGNPEKAVKIASDIVPARGYPEFSVSDDGVCTFVYNDMIYYSKNGSEKQKVKGPSDSEYFYGKIIVDTEGRIWVSEDGINYVDTKTDTDNRHGISITQ